ncbi:unnamed protein product [Meloidogyne enterolobii]|uniref:Uncharacterized protein n=1 Tax=Meloidogyne enterolobii TaxID=390850 RepID=A0ACB1ADN5_MELEN
MPFWTLYTCGGANTKCWSYKSPLFLSQHFPAFLFNINYFIFYLLWMMESTPYYKEKACQLLCLFFLSIRSFNPYLTTKCPYNSSIYPINFLYYSFLVVVTIAPYNNTRNNNMYIFAQQQSTQYLELCLP